MAGATLTELDMKNASFLRVNLKGMTLPISLLFYFQLFFSPSRTVCLFLCESLSNGLYPQILPT